MTILVTGCAGFIGWKITEFLQQEGRSVVGVDNLDDSYDVRLKKWRISRLKENPGFTFHRLDITSAEELDRIFRENSFEAVINLAAKTGVRKSIINPRDYFETNANGTLNLLELCRKHKVKKFVLASSSSVYGRTQLPFKEDAQTALPLSPYAASKKSSEALCYTYHHVYGLDITVFRYFTVYGPGGRPDMALFRFVRWVNEKEPVIVYGDGSHERDFTYVDDTARGTLLGLRSVGYEVVNLGTNRSIQIRELISILEKVVDKQALIEFRPAYPVDASATCADISKAKNLLGWQPKIAIEAGISHTVAWYKENRNWLRDIRTS